MSDKNTQTLLLLAVVGVGAYWLYGKQNAKAQVSGKPPIAWTQNPTRAIQPSGGGAGSTTNILAGLFSAANILMGGGSPTGTKTIANDDVPGQPGYGWQYYSDGTSIGPDGTYYKNGAALWSPQDDGAAVNNPSAYQSTASGYPTSYERY